MAAVHILIFSEMEGLKIVSYIATHVKKALKVHVISKYAILKVIPLAWEYIVLNKFFWQSCLSLRGQLRQKNEFNTIYSHTSAITFLLYTLILFYITSRDLTSFS